MEISDRDKGDRAVVAGDMTAGRTAPTQPVGLGESDELALAQARLEVALALVGLIYREVDDIDDRRAVVVDVVDRWRALNPDTRARWRAADSPISALARFAWEYVDQVEAADVEEEPADLDDALFRVWNDHARRLRGHPPQPAQAR